jgi:O-6-methylguanine DNA methyltransferase
MLFGSDSALHYIRFEHSRTSAPRPHEEGKPVQVERTMRFLDDYFGGDTPSLKKWHVRILPPNQKAAASDATISLDASDMTPNEIAVYDGLLAIAFGKTISYGELGKMCGFGCAGRFIGNAMAKNKFPIIIPCHRVIRSDGGIGNYSGGPGIKEYLLNYERI